MALEFEDADKEFYQKEYNKLNKDFNSNEQNIPIFNLKNGITQLRILPPKKGSEGKWMQNINEHWSKFVQGPLTCLRQFNEKCPFCDKGEALFKEGQIKNDYDLIDQSKEYRPRKQYVANVFVFSSNDSDNPGPRKNVLVLKFGEMIRRKLLELDQDIGGWGDITSVKNGVNLRISKSGEGLNTRYDVTPMPKRTDLIKDLSSIQVNINNLKLFDLNSVRPPKAFEDLKLIVDNQNSIPGFAPVISVSEGTEEQTSSNTTEEVSLSDDFDLSQLNLEEED